MKNRLLSMMIIILGCIFWSSILYAASAKDETRMKRLRVSSKNPHLLENTSGKPVFLNNYTLWLSVRRAKHEEIPEVIDFCVKNKYNAISIMVLDYIIKPDSAGMASNGARAFETGPGGLPDPLKPLITQGNDPAVAGQYDYWDHLDYIIDLAAKNGIYVFLHPAWGDWFSGQYSGQRPNDKILFNETNAYQYAYWIGKRYSEKKNILWVIGGDRSAVYNSKTRSKFGEDRDFRAVYRSFAKGLTEGIKANKNSRNGNTKGPLLTYHPRKWAPNSSEWFHQDSWLSFNSIQDTPVDQVKSMTYDYNLLPIKPTWLCEGIYEGHTVAWGVRYQAYQTVLAGAFGHTYGSLIFRFPPNWRQLTQWPGSLQMKYLYHIAREIWTDKQFLNRLPDQELIVGDQGETKGEGIKGDKDNPTEKTTNTGSSNRLTAMRGTDGKWAIVYSANGRNINLNLERLHSGKLDAYWYNPRNGKWWVNGLETGEMTPFLKNIKCGKGNFIFNPPGEPLSANDWVLLLK